MYSFSQCISLLRSEWTNNIFHVLTFSGLLFIHHPMRSRGRGWAVWCWTPHRLMLRAAFFQDCSMSTSPLHVPHSVTDRLCLKMSVVAETYIFHLNTCRKEWVSLKPTRTDTDYSFYYIFSRSIFNNPCLTATCCEGRVDRWSKQPGSNWGRHPEYVF